MCGIIFLIRFGGVIDKNLATECLSKIIPRGPDSQQSVSLNINDNNVFAGFTRLAIMDPSHAGMQPFIQENNLALCNGEIYNYLNLREKYQLEHYSECDCEIILPLLEKISFDQMVTDELDAEFATVVMLKNTIYAARDRYGVRPLYYGYNSRTNMIGFASELKALHPMMEFVEQVPPNYIFTVDLDAEYTNPLAMIRRKEYFSYANLTPTVYQNSILEIRQNIVNLLTAAVKKRLQADRPIGFLLSGGLDSALIVSIATQILGPDKIICFTTGLPNSPDVIAAKKVSQYLGIKNHHIVPFVIDNAIQSLSNVIEQIETYDTTTIRASTPQIIIAKYVKEHTDIKVLLSGEGSDEIHGSYRYFRDAPNPEEFHNETVRLLKELHLFDNQRTDRSMANQGLEVRVPFLDFEYVKFIMSVNPVLMMYQKYHMEKQIIRDSFVGYLPDEILYRSKEAFSDAVSDDETNWADSIHQYASKTISDDDITFSPYLINKPRTKDSLYFRNIFQSIYPDRCNIIPHYWLPRFQDEEVLDPSARVLKCY